jgi:hypothetical protein
VGDNALRRHLEDHTCKSATSESLTGHVRPGHRERSGKLNLRGPLFKGVERETTLAQGLPVLPCWVGPVEIFTEDLGGENTVSI